jgi:hypothetical protein
MSSSAARTLSLAATGDAFDQDPAIRVTPAPPVVSRL